MYPDSFDAGIKAHRTPKGHTLVRIEWWSQPQRRSRSWYESEKRKYPTEHDFEREFEIDWHIGSGDAYFPEFNQRGGVKFYSLQTRGILAGLPVFRGWDFGVRRPAVVFGQIDQTGRVWVYRELAPSNINIHEFRDLVLYASGQLSYDALAAMDRRRALEIIEQINNPKSGYPLLPWFETGSLIEWVDYAGPEATARQRIQTSSEQTDADVLLSGGIQLRTMYVKLETREALHRALMMPRKDRYPGIIWDPACRNLLRAMSGGLTRKKGPDGRPVGAEYNKPGLFDDLYDAESFWLCQELDPAMMQEDGTFPRGDRLGGVDTYLQESAT